MWYFEYKILFFDEIDEKQKYISGIVAADGLAESLDTLIHYYGEDNIIDIKKLMPIVDIVFEFDLVNEDDGFDHKIIAKRGV